MVAHPGLMVGAASYVAGKPLLFTVLAPHAPMLPGNHKTSFGGSDSDRAPLMTSMALMMLPHLLRAASPNCNVALGGSWEGCCRIWDGGRQL